MSVALDIGANRFRSLRCKTDRLLKRSCRAVYSVVDASESQRRLLQQTGIRYGACDDGFVLMGDAAAELARLFQIRTRDLMPDGRVPSADPLARQVISTLIEALLPKPSRESEICSVVAPVTANPAGNVADQGETWEFIARAIRLCGYRPVAYGSAMSLILATLTRRSFTGIGVVFGASHCDLSIAHRGMELCHCAIPRGSVWIDEQMAKETQCFGWQADGERYLDIHTPQKSREAFSGSLTHPRDDRAELLGRLHRDLLTDLMQTAMAAIDAAPRVLRIPQPLALVCGGGMARIHGFEDLLTQVLDSTSLPVVIGETQMATDCDATIARGALISAELESQARSQRTAAA